MKQRLDDDQVPTLRMVLAVIDQIEDGKGDLEVEAVDANHVLYRAKGPPPALGWEFVVFYDAGDFDYIDRFRPPGSATWFTGFYDREAPYDTREFVYVSMFHRPTTGMPNCPWKPDEAIRRLAEQLGVDRE